MTGKGGVLSTSRIAGGICRSLLAADGGKPGDQGGLLADTIEHINRRDVTDIMRHDKLDGKRKAVSLAVTTRCIE